MHYQMKNLNIRCIESFRIYILWFYQKKLVEKAIHIEMFKLSNQFFQESHIYGYL
jgi:hypothetical protein